MDSIDNVKRRILTRVPLAELVGETVKLDTRSNRPMGCCPFHDDSSPSFVIYDDHYHCFGCKARGDAIEFVRQTKGLPFFDTLRYLAEKYDVEAPELVETSKAFRQRKETANLYNIMRDAQAFYVEQLWGPLGGEARVYLQERGFTDETIKEYQFGLTPREGYGLIRHLRQKGYTEADMHACSLTAQHNTDGKNYDFFRARLLIPIRDPMGRVIGFGGRTTDNNKAKYLNSRETALFPKARTLFGLDRAKEAMRKKGRAIIVEGYMDALQLWNRGFPEAVAVMGTAFTEWQLKLLKPFVGEIVLLFDGDDAGAIATLKSVEVALGVPQIAVKAAILPEKSDPDTFVQEQGPDALEELCDEAADLLDYAISLKLKETHQLGIPDLVTRQFIPWLAQIRDHVQRSFLVTRIAKETGIPRDHLERELGQHFRQRNNPRPQQGGPQQQAPVQGRPGAVAPAKPLVLPKLDKISYEILGHVFFANPGDFDPDGLTQVVAKELDLHPLYNEFFLAMIADLKSGTRPYESIGNNPSIGDEALNLLERLRQSAHAFEATDRRQRIAKLLNHVKLLRLKQSVATLRNQLLRLPKSDEGREEQIRLLQLISEYNQDIKSIDGPADA